MTPERAKELQEFDLLKALQQAMEELSQRRRPIGRFYRREVGLRLLDNIDGIIQEALDSSKQFVHCYEGHPDIQSKPAMYRPRNAVGFDAETQE